MYYIYIYMCVYWIWILQDKQSIENDFRMLHRQYNTFMCFTCVKEKKSISISSITLW